jgi:acetylornithine deacetylase
VQDYRETLENTLKANRNKYIQILVELVQKDTQDIGHGIEGGREVNGQEYLRSVFQNMEVDSLVIEALTEETIQEAIHKYGEGNPGHNYQNRYNLYARFNGTGSRSMLFNGHIDTMPPGDEGAWTHPPFAAEIKDGRLYGLGVCDMKSGLAASIMAVRLLQDAGIKLPCSVIIASVCDEEGGGNGSIVAAMGGQKADAVVVCEPSDKELLLANMGFVFFHIELEGISCHSGNKIGGVNAIEKAIKIINALNELEHDWLLRYKHPLLPPPSGNIGVIQGGKAGSTVPDYCSFKTCVHYHPKTMNHDQVIKEYQHVIDLCCDGDDFLREHRPRVSIYQSGGAFEMERDHPLVTSFDNAWKRVYEKPAVINGSPFGCDARVWKEIAGCPTIQYGPGSIQQCHAIDEYIKIEDYLDAILVYAHLILDWGKTSV